HDDDGREPDERDSATRAPHRASLLAAWPGTVCRVDDADKLSDELERWLSSDGDKTLGGLVELFGKRSFAVLFVVLLGVPALPLPTGGATHVMEVVAMLIALQLIAG